MIAPVKHNHGTPHVPFHGARVYHVHVTEPIKEAWSREIKPYLAKLADALEEQGRSREDTTISFSGVSMKLSAREQKLCLASQQEGGIVLPPRLPPGA